MIIIGIKFKYTEYYLVMSTLYFWGKPITNRLFERDESNRNILAVQKQIDQISCGQKHCVMIIEQTVFGFGDNSEGQLGQARQQHQQAIIPIMIQLKQKIAQVACGWNHTLIRDIEGSVYSAGRGDHGQLGRGKNGNFHTFELVLKGAKQISAGKDHNLAVCGSKVMGWGNSKEGQLGLLTQKYYFYPHELNVYPTSLVFAGAKYSLFATSKGVFGCGINQNCQLGLGHQADVQVPRRLAIEEEVISISGGNYCAVKTASSQWYLWGSGGFGVFKYPTKMTFLKGGETVAMGLNFGLLSKNRQIWVWGSNRWGQLGIQEEFKECAYQSEEFSGLNLTGLACGCNFVIGFVNQNGSKDHSLSNHQKISLSQCNQEENSSISKELFKNFKKSSGSQSRKSLKDQQFRNQANEWTKFYEIQHDYDVVNDPKRQLFSQTLHEQEKQTSQPQFKKKSLNGAGYMTWEGGQHSLKRRVKLTESLKSLTSYQWSNIEKENKSLKEKLHDQRLQKQRIRQEYMNFLNMNEDNRVYSKILRLQEKIHKKGSQDNKKSQINNSDDFSKKLYSLKSLLESAL